MLTVSRGSTATVKMEFLDNGTLFDPYAVTSVKIYNPSGVLMATLTPTRIATGIWYANYAVDAAAPVGTWQHVWNWQGSVGVAAIDQYYDFTVGGTACIAHNFIGLDCDSECAQPFSGSETTAITIKSIPKRMKIFFLNGSTAFNPAVITVSVVDINDTVVYSGTLAGGQIIKEQDGSFYTSITSTLFDTAPAQYIFKWTYQATTVSEAMLAISHLFVLPVSIYNWLPRIRLQADKTMKVQNASFIGYTDAQLFYYLQSGLDEINMYPPTTSFGLDTFPSGYGQLLINAGTVYALYSQKLFSVDTDVVNFSDQGFSYTVDHFSRLNTVLTELLTQIKDTMSRFKMDFYSGGRISVQMVPSYPLGVVLNTAPTGSLFRNLFRAA